MKKKTAVLLMTLAFVAFTVPAVYAAAVSELSPAGTWLVSGTAKIDAVVELKTGTDPKTHKPIWTDVADLDLTLPKLAPFKEEFIFGPLTISKNGKFSDILLGINGADAGTWSPSACPGATCFTVNIGDPPSKGTEWTGWIGSVQSLLLSYLSSSFKTAEIVVTKASFSGKVASTKLIEGDFDVKFTVQLSSSLQVLITIQASSLYGKPPSIISSDSSSNSAEDAAAFIFDKLLAPALSFSGN